MEYNEFKQMLRKVVEEYYKSTEDTPFDELETFEQWVRNLMQITEEKWKPKKGETYYMPFFNHKDLYNDYECEINYHFHEEAYKNGLVCKTKKEAIEKAKKMLESIR